MTPKMLIKCLTNCVRVYSRYFCQVEQRIRSVAAGRGNLGVQYPVKYTGDNFDSCFTGPKFVYFIWAMHLAQ